MLTALPTVKARLGLLVTDTQYDALLTRAIAGFSARFDAECNRTFERTVGVCQDFAVGEIEVPVSCYPIEAVTRFEIKATEAAGWVEQTGVDYLIRSRCVISLSVPLRALGSSGALARVTYTGGYVVPGTTCTAGQTPLPIELENAVIEQVAFWFEHRDALGVLRIWPTGGNYIQLVDTDLLPAVRAVLRRYTRFSM
jgi:hypothetical protein